VSEQDAMSWASAEANELRTDGVRIVALGIGNDVDTNNLVTISGPVVSPPAPIDENVDVITTGFAALAADLAALANGNTDCDSDSLGLTASQSTGGCPTGGVALPRFRNCIENYIGTDPLDACADTSGGDNDADDAWPPDLNDDWTVNVIDRARVVLAIKDQADGTYTQRADLNADGTVNVIDRATVQLYNGATCTP
jgi:Dockerin type I domain